jgi:hypothetical protein
MTNRKRTINAKISSDGQFKSDLKYFQSKYPDLVVKSTGYSYRFSTPDGLDYVFTSSNTSNKFFGLFNQIKTECRQYEKNNPGKIPELTAADVQYFHFDNLERVKNVMYSVDITAAYPTTARNLEFITELTFERTMKLPKPDRLRIFGMLAKNETELIYRGGEIVEIKNNKSPLAKYFFNLCYEVGQNIFSVYRRYNSVSIFWVDCIFTNNLIDAEKINEDLNQFNYLCKIEKLENCSLGKNKKVFNFSKKGERKFLFLPRKYRLVDRAAYNFLNN